MPTDTIYGLVCPASSKVAVVKLYGLKHRHHKPGTIIASSVDQLQQLGLDTKQLSVCERYWPGPVSILLNAPRELEYLTQGLPELACRVVAGPSDLVGLLNRIGPVLTTSANMPGEIPATTIHEAEKYFGTDVDCYVDGGIIQENVPSTLIRITQNNVEVLRQGAATIN